MITTTEFPITPPPTTAAPLQPTGPSTPRPSPWLPIVLTAQPVLTTSSRTRLCSLGRLAPLSLLPSASQARFLGSGAGVSTRAWSSRVFCGCPSTHPMNRRVWRWGHGLLITADIHYHSSLTDTTQGLRPHNPRHYTVLAVLRGAAIYQHML